MISNSKHNKVMNDLRKMSTYVIKKNLPSGKKINQKIVNEIIFRTPDVEDIRTFVMRIIKNEKLNIVISNNRDEDVSYDLIDHSQYDIRRLINILEELKMMYGEDKITMDIFESYKQTSKTKDIDPGIYAAAIFLLNDYENIQSALSIYVEERATIPLMVHENYPYNIEHQYHKSKISQKMDTIYNISKCISESDKVDGLIYSNQCWNLQSVHGFYSCVMPSFYANKYPGKLRKKETYVYTKDYNKTSIKKINSKVIKKARSNILLKKSDSNRFFIYFIYFKIITKK